MSGPEQAHSEDRDHTVNRVNVALRLAESAWRDFNTRRSYEWKANFGLWTALGALAGFAWERSITGPALYCGYAVLFIIGVVYIVYWARGMENRNKLDYHRALFFWRLAEDSLGLPEEKPFDSAYKNHKKDQLWKTWSRFTQIVITVLLLALAGVSLTTQATSSKQETGTVGKSAPFVQSEADASLGRLSSGVNQNTNMNASQAIFSLFYAILYGAIFTISDRWRPFTFAGSNNLRGRKRVTLSILLLGLFPLSYFILSFISLSYIDKIGFLSLLMIIYLVAPLYAVYTSWAMLVSFQKHRFYSNREQISSPICESLVWIADHPPSKIYLCIFCGVLIIIPILINLWFTTRMLP